MDRSVVLTLIAVTTAQDDFGVWRETESSRDVYAQVDSVSRSEFFEAGRNGLNPQFVFTMFCGDYNGEQICEYNGKRYAIYRTYLTKTDTIELYAERKGGTNG